MADFQASVPDVEDPIVKISNAVRSMDGESFAPSSFPSRH